MKCSEARQILWPADDLRVGDDTVEEALTHAERCPDCSAFLEQDRQVAGLIRDSVPRAPAPRELRERLFTALARERAGLDSQAQKRRAAWGRRWVVVAAMALVALSAGSFALWKSEGGPGRPSAATAFAQDYLRRVVEQESMRGTDKEIAAFFVRELGVAVQPPKIPGFAVNRAIISLLNGRRGGVIEYAGKGQQLSFYVIPVGDDPITEPEDLRVGQIAGDLSVSIALSAETGLAVATWRDGPHQHALVGNAEVDELRLLAQRYACPVART